ncbi:MAG TPA: glycosyl hydrolase [Capillimicrobium sp.]|nr:glycosyl hydrolase [Capillimicrobium sp.]
MAFLLAIFALPAAAHAAADPGLEVGLADQKTEMFSDPRFLDLDIDHARLTVPWDLFKYDWQVQQVDQWMDAARQAGITDPLISFNRSRIDTRWDIVPTTRQFVRTLRKFRQRYPDANTFSLWNEPNLHSQPTLHRIGLYVKWYKAFKKECRGCTLLAGELIDLDNMESWTKRFQRKLGGSPAIWGLHNYRDVNRMQTDTLATMLKITKARIWMTETAGIVGRSLRGASKHFTPSPEHAAKAMKYLFTNIVTYSKRVDRVYVYNWNSSEQNEEWDSALIDYQGNPRPAYDVFVKQSAKYR